MTASVETRAAQSAPPKQRSNRWARPALGLLLPVGLAILWEIAVRLGLSDGRLVPPPSTIYETLADLARTGELLRHVTATLLRVAAGFALGTAAGTLLGAVAGYSGIVRGLIDPTLQGLRAVPSIAWIPLFILWLGIFETSKVALIAVGVFFPVYLGVLGAIVAVDRKIVEVGRAFRLSGFAMVRRILLPAVLPAYVISLRAGLGLGWMFVIAAEFMGASEGLGYLLIDGQQLGKPAEIVAAILAFAVLGKITDWIIVIATTPLLRWQDIYRTSHQEILISMLEINRVSKTYPNGVHALEALTLKVALGEIVAVVGGSGCGKSTLLRLASGLDAPSGGAVVLDGDTITSPHEKIGIVFQEPRLLPWLSVADNVGFGLESRPRIERNARVAAQLDRVGLTDKATVWPRELSGGQAQRVALARALVTRPEVLLLDEPFSALDAFTRVDLQDHLLDLWADGKPTLLVVTHDVDEAIVLADRVMVMRPRPGRLQEEIVTDLPRPRDRQSAAFDFAKRRVMTALDRSLDRRASVDDGQTLADEGAARWW